MSWFSVHCGSLPDSVSPVSPNVLVKYSFTTSPMRNFFGAIKTRSVVLVILSLLLLCPAISLADAVTDYNLAVQFYKQKRWTLAAEACEEFLKKYPEHVQAPMAQLYWGQSLVHLRDFPKARETFQLYLKDPRAKTDRALAMYRVGESSYFLNDVQAAATELNTFLTTYPDHELAEWATVYLGQSQFQLNKIPQAIATFEKSLTRYPNSALKSEAQYGLARAYEAGGQTDQAAELYQKLIGIQDDPLAASALFHLAALNFSRGDYSLASQRFQDFSSKYPENRLVPLANLNAGYANYQLKQFQEAIKLFEAASKAESQKLTSLYWIGLSHKSAGQYQAAIKVFEDAIALGQDQPLLENISFQAGDASLRLKNYSKSIGFFSSVYEKFPTGEFADDALHSACEAALQAGELTKAAELNSLFEQRYAESGLKLVQELLYGRVLIAIGDQAQGDEAEQETFYRKATQILQKVVSTTTVDETKNFARFQLARAYERLSDEEKLVATLEPFLLATDELNDYALDSLLLLANAKLRKEEYDDAIKNYQRLLSAEIPSEMRLPIYQGLTSSYIAKQDWDSVSENLRQIKQFDDQDKYFSQLSLAAGDAAFDEGNWPQSQAFFEMGTQREVDNQYYLASLSGLGHAVYKQDKFASAADIFKKLSQSVFSDPKLEAHSYYMMGMSRRQADQLDGALEAYQTGLEKFGNDAKSHSAELQSTLYGLAKGAARTARDSGQIVEADMFYSKAVEVVELIPERSDAELDKLLFEWADMHYNAEAYDKADKLYGRLLEARPESSLADDAALILAESLRFAGKVQSAETDFRKLVQSEQADDFIKQRAFIHLVDLGSEQKKWQQVLDDAKTVQKQFPANEHQLYLDYRIAEAFLQTDQVDAAVQKLEGLQESISKLKDEAPPWWEEVWILRAQAALEEKEYSDLEDVVDDLRSRSPESKVIHRADLLLGRGYENQAKFEEARSAYLRAIESESGSGTETAAEAQFRVAESYLKQNNLKLAFKEYYKVYTGYDAPGYEAAALFQAARADAKMKNWKGAVQTFKILLEEFPQSEYADDAKQQLNEIETAFPELRSESK